MKRLGYRRQRTIAAPIKLNGTGFVTGKPIQLRILPAPADTGLIFIRSDLSPSATVGAHVSEVTGTYRRTTLGNAPIQVTLVEHILASLRGLRVDNCYIELNGPEPPGLDGSAAGFCQEIVSTGFRLQDGFVTRWAPHRPIILEYAGASIGFYPDSGDQLKITYFLDYGPRSPIPPQSHSETISPETFISAISNCRTFVLESEAEQLQKMGIGRHLTYQELLVFGNHGPIDNSLRFADEPARHKILDLIGDLGLCGFDLVGHVIACRTGHPQNIELASKIYQGVFGLKPNGNFRRAA